MSKRNALCSLLAPALAVIALAVPLTAMAVLGLLATVVGYFKQVSSQRYPKKQQ